MADLSDVLDAIGELIGSTLYPTAPATDTTPSPVANAPVLVQAGWPDSASLERDVFSGKAQVTLFPTGRSKNRTRYPEKREELALPAATWTLTASGQTVTVGGSNANPYAAQNLCVFANGKAYVYQPTNTDTAASAATALQALIVADVAGVTVAGAVITFPAAARIGALRVGVMGQTIKEVGRQDQEIAIITWAGTPTLRDAVVKAIDPALRASRRVSLPDGSTAHLTFVETRYLDNIEKEGIYRRDLVFMADYGTTLTETFAQVVANEIEEDDAFNDVIGTTYS